MSTEVHRAIEDALGRNPRTSLVKDVKSLLEDGEDVNYRDSTSRTPLDYCVLGVMNAGKGRSAPPLSPAPPTFLSSNLTNHTLSIL